MAKDPILADLNAEQRAVVTAADGPTLVVAGAGSGKTTTLVRRVAWLIRRGVPPASILLLTFTRASAAHMIGRARALAPEARDVTGGTFHSIGNLVLRQLHAVFGLPERFTVLDPEDVEQALKGVMAELPWPASERGPKPSTVANVISLATNTKCSMDEALFRRAVDHATHPEWFTAVGKRYAAWKLDRALLDYDDLLVWFAVALQDPTVGAHLRERWRHVLVDEHQDSNQLQLDIVYGLGGESPNVMVVGDPAQAIYGFRGSAPATLFHFRERWPATRVLALQTNYRSTQAVLDLVNAVDRAMSPRFDRELRAASEEVGERPALVPCADDRAQAEEVCRRILAARDGGVPLHDQAVLVRSMWVARRIEAELVARRIPYRVVGGLRIDEAAHVKDALSLLRVADNPRNEPAWTRVLGRLGGMGPASVKKALLQLAEAPDGAPAERLAAVKWPKKVDPGPLVDALDVLGREGSVGERIRGALSAFEPVFRATYEAEWPDRAKDLETVATIADDHFTLTDFLAAVTLDYGLDARERAGAASKPDERPITLSTVHSAKGLEWHTVHVPGFVTGHIPSPYAAATEEIAEELRVFYVATSRARRRLYLYRPLLGENGWLRAESPYERLVAAYLGREEPGPREKAARPDLGGVRIDMRARLLGDD